MCTTALKETIILRTQDVLNEEFTNPNKRRMRPKGHGIEMACPVCGDSHKDSGLKRGFLYYDTMKFHCFNGDCIAKYWDVIYFFNSFNKKIGNIDLVKEIGAILKDTKRNRRHITLQNSSDYFKYLSENSIRLQKVIDFYGLKSSDTYDWSRKFIEDRILTNYKARLYFRRNKWGKDEVWILNTIGNDKVIGLQIKNLSGGPKYLTKDFSKLNEDMGYTLDYPEESYKNICDNLSLIFNIFNINLDAIVTVFEGPIDSFFMNNSVATAGASKIKDFFDDIDNIRFFYDNDKTGKTMSISKLKAKLPSFMWKKFFKDFQYEDKRIKDLNELIAYAYNSDNTKYVKSINKLSDYFGQTKYDIYNV